MKKIIINLFGLVLVLVIAIAATSGAQAAPADSRSPGSEPFQGIFYGWVHGDQNSQAPMILDLTQGDGIVQGDIYLGEGLVVDGGFCGTASVPAGMQSASGLNDSKDSGEFSASTSFQVQGLDIDVEIASRIADDGGSLTAEARIDLPWFCGEDPVVSGTLLKYQPQ
jgi:hypothetical protein